MPTSPSSSRRKFVRAALSVLLGFLLVTSSLPVVASAADVDAELGIEAFVTGHQGEVPTISPGETLSYTVNLQCSANHCLNAVISAKLPSPLVYDDPAITVSPNLATTAIAGQQLTITFVNEFHQNQLDAGQVVMVTVKAKLPADASADYNGAKADFTFTAAADNADSVSDTASAQLNVPVSLKVTATKSVSPEKTQPAIPGRTVSFTLGARSESNLSVDAITIADPTDPGTANPFDYLALTDIDELTPPTGADKVAFDWFDGTDWHNGSAVTLPSDPSDLLPSAAELAGVEGVRFSFTASSGGLPAGEPAKVVLKTSSRAAFGDLDEGESIEVVNTTTTAAVAKGAASASDAAQDSITFKKQSVQVAVTKKFDDETLVANHSTTATLTASTGVMPTSTITINEPGSGPSLAAQGLAFGGFVTTGGDDQLTWPEGATTATITYSYTDGSSSGPLATTEVHSLRD
ncbi:MAG TPA: hypothetical protein PLB21_15040, partial [Actinomycetota bacterium]|nr:hypothetical protein [Actinomycetota bacterium]